MNQLIARHGMPFECWSCANVLMWVAVGKSSQFSLFRLMLFKSDLHLPVLTYLQSSGTPAFLAQLYDDCVLLLIGPHTEHTCSTYAWDDRAVTKANDSFEILAHWAFFKCHYCRASVSSGMECSLTCRGWDRPLCWSSQQHHARPLCRVFALQRTPINVETMKGQVHIEQLQIWNVAGVCMRTSCTMMPGLFCMLVPCSIKILNWLKVCCN